MRNLTNDELRMYNQSLDKIFTPRTPTQSELEDIFTPQQEIENTNRRTPVNYTYAIGILRTEYEKLEDKLDHMHRYEKEYGILPDEEKVTGIINKLNELNRAIEVLKGID